MTLPLSPEVQIKTSNHRRWWGDDTASRILDVAVSEAVKDHSKMVELRHVRRAFKILVQQP